MFHIEKDKIVTAESALKGRDGYLFQLGVHHVFSEPMTDIDHCPNKLILGMGCFWGAERLFWQTKGVLLTAVGYAGGSTPFATYNEVCTGKTGHTEVVAVAYNPEIVSLDELLTIFWESHDPTQGMRQGNDIGTQYRSALYLSSIDDLKQAEESKTVFQKKLNSSGFGDISTEVAMIDKFYFAEPEHQQYLDKNPAGYCGLKGTGVTCI